MTAPERWFSPCAVCGGEVTGYTIDAVTERARRMTPLWEGGPLIENPDLYDRRVVVDHVLTVDPCGHENPPDQFRMYEGVRTPAPDLYFDGTTFDE